MTEECQPAIFPLTEIIIDKSSTQDFDCGQKFLNNFLVKSCAKKLEKNLIRGHAVMMGDQIVAYITLRVHSLEKSWFVGTGSLPKQVPVLMIDQIATDLRYQGRGIGRDLLAEAFKSAVIISEQAGLKGVVLWSHPDAVGFYSRLGMVSIATKQDGDIELTLMFISIESIIAAMEDYQAAS